MARCQRLTLQSSRSILSLFDSWVSDLYSGSPIQSHVRDDVLAKLKRGTAMYSLLFTAALLAQNPETETIRKAIDNICGDTWCEGDYKFRFQKVVLDSTSNSTQVFFTMRITDSWEVSPQATIRNQQFYLTCSVPGFSTYGSIMQSGDSLNWDFYTSLTDCIQTLEGRLSRVFRVN